MPPVEERVQRVLYGAAQPLLGLRVLVGDGRLLRTALLPVLCIAVVCAVTALDKLGKGWKPLLLDFYRTFAVLAPLPSVLMRRHYGKLVVRARARLGFPEAEACIEPLWPAIKRAIAQAILIAIAVMPASVFLNMIPVLGKPLVRVLAAAWALHWIVVDAFEASRTRPPGQKDDPRASCERLPWFVRAASQVEAVLPLGRWPMRKFAAFCDRMSRPWRAEIATVEAETTLALGFALSTAALLATPVLNLFFRPIVLVGAVHLLGRLEQAPQTAGPPEVAPAPA